MNCKVDIAKHQSKALSRPFFASPKIFPLLKGWSTIYTKQVSAPLIALVESFRLMFGNTHLPTHETVPLN